MRRLVALLGVSLVVAACATPPDGPVAAADRAAPHQLIFAQRPATLPVDGDTGFVVPGFVATNPAGLIGGLIGQAIVTAIEAPAAQRRAERRQMLQGSLGDTAAAAEIFGQTFDSTVETALRELPDLRLAQVDVAGAQRLPGAALIAISRDALVSVDARKLVGRAAVAYLSPGATGVARTRHFLYFSDPIEVSGDAHATFVWREQNGLLLRDRSAEVARGLAHLIRDQLFDLPPVDLETTGLVTASTAGAQYLPRGFPFTAARPPRLPERVRAYLVRREPGRALLLVPGMGEGPDWIWVSVPDSALPSPGS